MKRCKILWRDGFIKKRRKDIERKGVNGIHDRN